MQLTLAKSACEVVLGEATCVFGRSTCSHKSAGLRTQHVPVQSVSALTTFLPVGRRPHAIPPDPVHAKKVLDVDTDSLRKSLKVQNSRLSEAQQGIPRLPGRL